MRILTACWALFVITLTSGCTGHILTKNLTPDEVSAVEGKFKGVIYYPQGLFYEISKTTIRKDETGKIIGWATEKEGTSKYCKPLEQYKLITRTDFTRPKLISYKPGVLDAYKFGVTLSSDGNTLIGVTSESSPDRGQTFSNLTSAAVNGAKVAAATVVVYDSCNDGFVVIKYKSYDEWEAGDDGNLKKRVKNPGTGAS